jgi:AraC-like DNA-binding protein
MIARSTDPADYQRVPRPVAAMAKEFEDGHHIAPHTHERAQLIFAADGVMTVTTPEGSWVVPPLRAVWMPAGVTHEIHMAGAVAMRTLYVRPDAAGRLPGRARVIAVSTLLRELILRACTLPVLYDEAGPDGRIVALILDEIAALPTLALDLPMPRDPRVRRICQALRADPGATRTLSQWARTAGASSRTLARRFARETGLTFADWRQQARLLAAMARLAAGESITTIAMDLGYDSPSAFSAMFRRTLGTSPSRYLGREPVRAARQRRARALASRHS